LVGKESVNVMFSKKTRSVNFTQYMTMQSDIVLFTREFEAYLKAKLGEQTIS
jgi:hypothetical protein